jgi:gamma-glutamyltranspeptidase/glutathione hydrolase
MLTLGAKAALMIVSAVVSAALSRAAPPVGAASPENPPAHAARFAHEAVAADQPLASAAGEEILAKGGNAVDAAVATSFALSVVRPFSCGIGGGGFMVIVLPAGDGKASQGTVTTAINYREMCPAGVGADYYEKMGDAATEASRHGGKAIATPGTIAGLLYALDKYGTMKRADVLAPAIHVARDGFVADEAYAKAAADTISKFEKHPEWKTRFGFAWERFLASGKVKAGDRITLPEQAKAFELIARDGLDALTKGDLGKAICEASAKDGGALTLDDLRAFKVVEVEPLRFEALGRTLVTMPPPSSGGVAMAETLGIMERQAGGGAAALVKNGEWPQYTHLLIEAFDHAFADRAEWMADPAFVEVPVKRLLSEDYLKERAICIQPTGPLPREIYGTHEKEEEEKALPDDGGTSHLCVVDSKGGAVSCTETINLEFGSLVAVPEYGFILNDQMDDFTTRKGQVNAFGLVQSEKNLPAPGKRPLSSMTPTIVLDKSGKVEAVAGASGGPRIITGTTQVLLNSFLLGLPAGEAVARPRLHHQWMPNMLEMEDNYPGKWNGLEVSFWMIKLHHQQNPAKEHACVQLIRRHMGGEGEQRGEGGWDAACDPRKGGAPAGK